MEWKSEVRAAKNQTGDSNLERGRWWHNNPLWSVIKVADKEFDGRVWTINNQRNYEYKTDEEAEFHI
jgi:hypothetical protein